MNGRDQGLPIEQFIQALSSQLDRAQQTMALKAKAGLPLTFAVKDLSLDLHTHVEMSGSEVRIRPAGPGDTDTSVLHLALTTITKPMIEENTFSSADDEHDQNLDEVLPGVSEDERRRLEWAGVRTVSQLREVSHAGGEDTLGRVADLPVDRLRAALSRASQPYLSDLTATTARSVPGTADVGDAGDAGDARDHLLRIRGRNLVSEGLPVVRMGGDEVPVLRAHGNELLVRPAMHHLDGAEVEVEPRPGDVVRGSWAGLAPSVASRSSLLPAPSVAPGATDGPELARDQRDDEAGQ